MSRKIYSTRIKQTTRIKDRQLKRAYINGIEVNIFEKEKFIKQLNERGIKEIDYIYDEVYNIMLSNLTINFYYNEVLASIDVKKEVLEGVVECDIVFEDNFGETLTSLELYNVLSERYENKVKERFYSNFMQYGVLSYPYSIPLVLNRDAYITDKGSKNLDKLVLQEKDIEGNIINEVSLHLHPKLLKKDLVQANEVLEELSFCYQEEGKGVVAQIENLKITYESINITSIQLYDNIPHKYEICLVDDTGEKNNLNELLAINMLIYANENPSILFVYGSDTDSENIRGRSLETPYKYLTLSLCKHNGTNMLVYSFKEDFWKNKLIYNTIRAHFKQKII